MRNLCKLLCFVVLATGFAGSGFAVTNTVPCNFLSISNALATANEGDVILIQPGTCTISNTITTKADTSFTIRGSGTNQTTLISAGLDICIVISQSNGIAPVISDLNCVGNSANSSGFFVASGPVHFYNIQMTNISRRGISFMSGLVDHCVFVSSGGNYQAINFEGNKYGSWTNVANPIGTTNAAYVEDCYFDATTAPGNGHFDAYNGAQLVFRNNLCNGPSYSGGHGYDSGDSSARTWEIYGNVFTNVPINTSSLQIRGGTGVIWSNYIYGGGGSGFGIGRLDYYRCDLTNATYVSSCGTPGRGYDVNFTGAAQQSGTVLSFPNNPTNGQAVRLGFAVYYFVSGISNALWGMQGSPGYGGAAVFIGGTAAETATNLYNAVNVVPSAAGVSYATTYYYNGTIPVPQPIYLGHDMVAIGVSATDCYMTNALDGNTDQYGYPANQQVGVLVSYPLTSTNFVNNQVLWPVYCWSNVVNGVVQDVWESTAGMDNLVKPGRDLFNNVTPSAATYTPLVYPHPLQATKGDGSPNPAQPLPPSRLTSGPGQ